MSSVPETVAVPKYLLERERALRSERLIQAAAVLAAIAFLAAAVALQRPINSQRQQEQLAGGGDVKNIPPQYAWITAMAGSFRGLAIDFLWMRAESLKEEGKYYESDQLAQWICDLQPRFAAVWQYHAWNLAYNISVATHTPEERWQWVYNGVRLLRDKGIPNNPKVIGLYKELSWIIFHKIGDILDDMHYYYKREWAAMFENILGPPPLTGDPQAVIDAFRPVAEAPRSWEEFAARHPDIETHVSALREAGVNLHETAGKLWHPLERSFFDRYGTFVQGTDVELARYRAKAVEMTEHDRKFVEAWRAIPPDTAQALLAYLRSKVLREQYKMDPAFMLSLMTNLIPGEKDFPVPFDWRLPEPHAIYWSRYGVERGRQLKNYSDIDVLNTDRFTLFSLMTLCKRGRLVFEIDREKPNRSPLQLTPDLRMVEPMHRMFLALGKVHAEPGENVGDTAGEMLKSGHVNTLEQAIVLFWARGQTQTAARYLAYLRDNYKEPDGTTKKRYQTDVETFALGQAADQTESMKEALALIHSLITGGHLSLAEGNTAGYLRQIDLARKVWDRYMKDKTADEAQGRRSLPPFEEMRANALRDFLVYLMPSVLARINVWQLEDPRIKQIVYNEPRLVEFLRDLCEQAGLDPAKAFPEPPGMEEYRKAHPFRERPEEDYQKLIEQAAPGRK